MQKDYFLSQNKVLNKLVALGQTLGNNPNSPNPMNSLRTVVKTVEAYIALNEKAEALGYTSAAIALKALSQVKESIANADLSKLPEVFHKVPSIWLDGKPNRGNKKGFVRLTVAQAERAHRVIVPLLVEAWQLADGEEGIHDQITRQYLTTSSKDFEATLYKFIHELEEVSLEEELQDWELDPSVAELMAGLNAAQLNHDYGVGGELDEVNWDD